MRKITNEQLYTLLNNNSIILIDIRDADKYIKGHIANSINIPFRYLITNPSNYLNKINTYVLICDYGITSNDAAIKLSNLGYKVITVLNGIVKWKYGLVI